MKDVPARPSMSEAGKVGAAFRCLCLHQSPESGHKSACKARAYIRPYSDPFLTSGSAALFGRCLPVFSLLAINGVRALWETSHRSSICSCCSRGAPAQLPYTRLPGLSITCTVHQEQVSSRCTSTFRRQGSMKYMYIRDNTSLLSTVFARSFRRNPHC